MAAVTAGRLAGRLGNAANGARVPILARLGQTVAGETGEGSRLGRQPGRARRVGVAIIATGLAALGPDRLVVAYVLDGPGGPAVLSPHVDQAALRRRSLRTRSVMPTLMTTLMRIGAKAGGAPLRPRRIAAMSMNTLPHAGQR